MPLRLARFAHPTSVAGRSFSRSTRRRRPSWLLFTALLAPLLAGGPAALAAPGDDATDPALQQTVTADESSSAEPTTVKAGHVDVGPRVVEGKWTVQARDDSGATPVWRDLDQTVLQVTDSALLDAPTEPAYSFMGGQAGERWYVVPQTQSPDVVWLGWNTQDPGVTKLVDRGATMRIGPVTGPGKSWMFLQNGTFGEPLLLVDGQKEQPQDVWVDVNTHVHANWVFTQPGIYLARLSFEAQTVDGRTVQATSTLRFAVGSQTSSDDALKAAVPWAAEVGSKELAGPEAAKAGTTPATSTPAGSSPASGSAAGSQYLWYVIGSLALALVAALLWVLAQSRRRSAAERAAAIAEVHASAPTPEPDPAALAELTAPALGSATTTGEPQA
ncbi:putative ABC transporter-associated repeat protein [Actinomyces bovis]|uniref:ABC transporter-associated repeat protein n=1 Tax=Actinomyces bovis TaxID=1658 RepID=A0ABY1VND5_9ACTO|nr:choice-of-anchor M domain-containing protein [Actinomyces bovis]SPT52573.1 putative ABC transporter-associated repeat protein [Actinomyces bovis]VEG54358.1 putative ABC transporter-associated repeat protein [Actinomyces israelii]